MLTNHFIKTCIILQIPVYSFGEFCKALGY